MALTVEDGSGVVNADAYISVADALTYHSNMGNSDWANRPDLHEVAIRNATLVRDQRSGTVYKGKVISSTQSLLYPRTAFTDNNGRSISASTIPQSLANSTAELALVYIQQNGVLIADTTKQDALSGAGFGAGSGAITDTETYFYAVKEKYTTKSDLMIAPLLDGAGGSYIAQRG